MPDGRVVNKMIEHPQSTLHVFALQPEDVKELERIPQFPMNSSQLSKYELKYIGQETDRRNRYVHFQSDAENVWIGRMHIWTESCGSTRNIWKW